MKKALICLVAVCLVVTAFGFISKDNSAKAQIAENSASKTDVITVSNSDKTSADYSKILESRFLNMLNHNFVYDSTFDSVEDMVNESMPALLGFRDSEDDSFIAENFVADYVFNMYEMYHIEALENAFADIDKLVENKTKIAG